MQACFTSPVSHAIPLEFISEAQWPAWLAQQTSFCQTWLQQQKFTAKPNTFCVIPDNEGHIACVVAGIQDMQDKTYAGHLVKALPQGIYQLTQWDAQAALAWGMGAYQFIRYKAATKTLSQLVVPADKSADDLVSQVTAIYLVRDLVNTPTEDMGPAQLAEAAEKLASEFAAEFTQIVGDALLTENYPAIHAVGRASAQAPRLLDLRWGDAHAPKITLVGKGVCFDSGGLDIKTASNMALMKKDMGGAAHVLGLARLIMQAQLPVRLRVLIPAVENAISGNAYRPGDVIKTRKGLTVEIGNTDAEGRVILSDALTEACSEQPALLIDMATLTGAARVALGTELPAFFTPDENIAQQLTTIGITLRDPLWRLPLYTPYRKWLDSTIADLNNATTHPYAGAITAALFLQAFVPNTQPWLHFDIMGWNLTTTPAHPEGADAVAIRTLFAWLQQRFADPKMKNTADKLSACA